MLARITLNESGLEHTEDLIWLPETENESILLHELFVLLGALASHLYKENQSSKFADWSDQCCESVIALRGKDLKSDACDKNSKSLP
jgi:hypothetical protein